MKNLLYEKYPETFNPNLKEQAPSKPRINLDYYFKKNSSSRGKRTSNA
jgi:hypothetical protein